MALMARGGRQVGSAFITLPQGLRERLWRRVEERSKSKQKTDATQWVQRGIVGRVRYLKGEAPLRHASLKDWRDAEDAH